MSWNWLFSFPLLGYFFPNVFHCSLKTHFKVGYSKVIPSILARHDIKTEVYLSHSLKNRRKKIRGEKKIKTAFFCNQQHRKKSICAFLTPILTVSLVSASKSSCSFCSSLAISSPTKNKKNPMSFRLTLQWELQWQRMATWA